MSVRFKKVRSSFSSKSRFCIAVAGAGRTGGRHIVLWPGRSGEPAIPCGRAGNRSPCCCVDQRCKGDRSGQGDRRAEIWGSNAPVHCGKAEGRSAAVRCHRAKPVGDRRTRRTSAAPAGRNRGRTQSRSGQLHRDDRLGIARRLRNPVQSAHHARAVASEFRPAARRRRG